MNELTKWHVVYTNAGCERKVTEQLLKQNIECYCAFKYVSKFTYWKSDFIETPLFAQLVFVCITEQQYTQVLDIYGVSNLLYWLDKPAVITSEEIDLMRKYTYGYRCLGIEKIRVNPYLPATVFDDTFVPQNNNVVELNTTCTKVLLPSLGYALFVISQNNVQVVDTTIKRRFFWQLERKQAS